ncbi:MAG: SLC13 family permease [Halorhabdus sp.]
MAAVTVEILVVFALIAGAVVLFATEIVSPDVTAISVVVASVVLEPWTGIGTEQALIGFANTATITVAAMYMLSEGIHRTGLVRRLGRAVSRVAHGSRTRRIDGGAVRTADRLAGRARRSQDPIEQSHGHEQEDERHQKCYGRAEQSGDTLGDRVEEREPANSDGKTAAEFDDVGFELRQKGDADQRNRQIDRVGDEEGQHTQAVARREE